MNLEIFSSSNIIAKFVGGFSSEAIVVTFDSYTDERGLNRAGFGEDFFKKNEIDAIHFISYDNDWYQYQEIYDALKLVNNITNKYVRAITYGSSMGGYAAIRFGGLAGASTALAISPQFSIDPLVVPFEMRWPTDASRIDFIIEKNTNLTFVKKSYVAYDPYGPDIRHIDLYRPHTEISDLPIKNSGHPSTGYILETGLLQTLVLDIVKDSLDVTNFLTEARARRRTAGQFYFHLSNKARTPIRKLRLIERAVSLEPKNAVYLMHYGISLARLNRLEEADAAVNQATALAPENPRILYNLSEFWEIAGNLGNALKTMEDLVRQYPEALLYRPRLEYIRNKFIKSAKKTSISYKKEIFINKLLENISFYEKKSLYKENTPIDTLVTTTPSPPQSKESWMRHENLLSLLPLDTIDYLLFGDFFIEYWPAYFWQPRNFFNLGVADDKTQHSLWRLADLKKRTLRAKKILIMLGTNNLISGDTNDAIIKGIISVVSELTKITLCNQALVIQIPPCGKNLEFRNSDRSIINNALHGKGFKSINVDDVLIPPNGNPSQNYKQDNLNLNLSGYKLLNNSVLNFFS